MEELYAPARRVDDIHECFFYHTMDLPGYGVVQGQWDLRGNVDAYLGHVDLKGKRVLEVGTASGFLCFEMEKRGAEVVAYDLSALDEWDIVPHGGQINPIVLEAKRKSMRQLNNGWWLAHRAMNSKARVVYGPVYAIPESIGPIDVATFGSILLHLRDPFLALQRACALVSETVVVTDLMPSVETTFAPSLKSIAKRLLARGARRTVPYLVFLPDCRYPNQADTWWQLPPITVARFLNVLGFPKTEIRHHRQKYLLTGTLENLYTVVGKR